MYWEVHGTHIISGIARAFHPGGKAAHPEDQNEEENEESIRKMWEATGKWGKIEKMFLTCPPGSVGKLATALDIINKQEFSLFFYLLAFRKIS